MSVNSSELHNAFFFLLQSHKYTAVGNSSECFCDATFNNYGQAVEGSCNLPCAGKPDEICGGEGFLSAYVTGER